MTLFSVEALLLTVQGMPDGDLLRSASPAHVDEQGAFIERAMPHIRNAYLDWLDTQSRHPPGTRRPLAGTLAARTSLRRRQAPGNTCLQALESGGCGTPRAPLNQSSGCGGVMRSAPFGLLRFLSPWSAFDLGARSAALTHGHPDGWVSAGALCAILRSLIDGAALVDAVDLGRSAAEACGEEGRGTVDCLERGMRWKQRGERPTPVDLALIGGGWTGHEALGIAVACALAAENPADGIRLAANHSGDSDSTASIAGQILGAAGVGGLPAPWIAALDLRPEVEAAAAAFIAVYGDEASKAVVLAPDET